MLYNTAIQYCTKMKLSGKLRSFRATKRSYWQQQELLEKWAVAKSAPVWNCLDVKDSLLSKISSRSTYQLITGAIILMSQILDLSSIQAILVRVENWRNMCLKWNRENTLQPGRQKLSNHQLSCQVAEPCKVCLCTLLLVLSIQKEVTVLLPILYSIFYNFVHIALRVCVCLCVCVHVLMAFVAQWSTSHVQ